MNASTETSTAKASSFECYRQVWRAWSYWPVFRAAVWIMMLQWVMALTYLYMSNLGKPTPWQEPYSAYWMLLFIGSSMLKAILTVAVPLMIVGHVKTQMASWHASLMPHFRRPHLVVVTLISAGIFIVMACAPLALQLVREYGDMGQWRMSIRPAMHWSDEDLRYTSYSDNDDRFRNLVFVSALYDLATVVFMFAITGLAAARFSPRLALAFLVIAGFCYSTGTDWLPWHAELWWMAEYNPLSTTLLFLLDAILLVSLWRTLRDISGERDIVPTDERLPWLSNLLAGRESEPAGALVGASLWRRVRHRRRIGLGHRFIWITAVYLVFLVGIQIWIDPHNQTGLAFCAVFAPGVVSALAIGLSWPLRFAALGEVEMLRPSRRVEFAREIGLAMLLDAVEIYLATLAAVLVPLYIWMPSALGTLTFQPALKAAVLTQILIFGATVWCIRLRSWAVSMGLSVLAVLAISVLITQAMDDRQFTLPLAGAAIGIVLTADAYRQWLRMDMH